MAEVATELTPQGPTAWRRIGRVVAVIFFTWTAVAITFTMIPTQSIIWRKFQPLVGRYRMLTGLDQHWDMFASVPNHRAYEVTVEVEPPSGGGWRTLPGIGPVIPGLREVPGHFRYHTYFTRLDEKRYVPQVIPYTQRLADEILREHPELTGGKFRLRKTAHRIQALETIRDLGEPSFEQSTLNGPYPLTSATK